MSHSRDDTLAVLQNKSIKRLPVFSGLPCLTSLGLESAGLRYSETHSDSTKMAAAAASTFETCGWESAVVPFDLCVEAEALGCHVDFQNDLDIFMPPVVDVPLDRSFWRDAFTGDRVQGGRIPLVCDAIGKLKAGVGREIAIGAWVPGPFTLAWQLFGADSWLSGMQDNSETAEILSAAASFVSIIARSYVLAGADFLTVHEMGGSPQVIGADAFRILVKPALRTLFSSILSPKVLSICGNTNDIVIDAAECGADALNFDHQNNIDRTRRLLPRAILLGNLDPVGTLSQGTSQNVLQARDTAARAGVNAIWPGCDLQPDIPKDNLLALMGVGFTYTPS